MAEPLPELVPCLGDASCKVEVIDAKTCVCELIDLPDLAPCNDGDPCTTEDRCTAGSCAGKPLTAFETGLACDDGNPCTADECDPEGGCAHTPTGGTCDDGDPCTAGEMCDSTACGPPNQLVCGTCDADGADDCEASHGDGDPCTGTLVCQGGWCRLAPGTAVTCEQSDDPCAVLACDPGTGACGSVAVADGTPCTDGSACTLDDACVQGVCTGTPSPDGACTCVTDAECALFDDGNHCNGEVICVEGVCLYDPGTVVKCDGAGTVGCVVFGCNPVTGKCEGAFLDDGVTCDDGDLCTEGETCAAGFCGEGVALGCGHLDGTCLVGLCDSSLGCLAEGKADGTSCPITDACQVAAVCQAGACVTAGAIGCDDLDACTVDVCDPASGCQHLGPAAPSCPADGVCSAGVPVSCGEGGQYHCGFDVVSGWSPVDVCGDGLDNDCDGATDESQCVVVGCAVGVPAYGYGDSMIGCAAPELSAAELQCEAGWHVCGWSEVASLSAGQPVPEGYWMAAAITWDAAEAGFSVVDVTTGACQPFEGQCGHTRTLQAMTWPGIYEGSVAYAAEAWGCEAGEPTADCESVALEGVMCCVDACADDAACDDGDPCTGDVCDPATGACVSTPHNTVACPAQGVCADAGEPVCDPVSELYVCDLGALPAWEAAEVSCDGLDNDCDGLTDQSDPDLLAVPGPPCEKGAGVCAGATKDPAGHCKEGQWLPCTDAHYTQYDYRYVAGQEAACDGADENCDGQTDEAFAWQATVLGAACSAPGVCGSGVVVCAADEEHAICSVAPGGPASPATAEGCNGLDDDCDGETDEADDLSAADSGCDAPGVCALATPTCEGGDWSCGYDAVLGWSEDGELCDQLDNDCDGETDEGLSWLDPIDGLTKAKGAPCGDLEGCAGEVVCVASGDGMTCSSADGATEVCDGFDNDCDGETDEDLVLSPPGGGADIALGEACVGVGACGIGTVECSGTTHQAICSSMPGGSQSGATPETCDGEDDDCDGATDDGMTWEGAGLGQACDGVGACGIGEVVCDLDAVSATCSTNPDAASSEAAPEACNGLDDDCDGLTDDGVDVTFDGGCLVEGVCEPANTVADCAGADGWVYQYASPAYQEGDELGACDGLDNDCDGATDEDFPGLGDACDRADDADDCALGELVCGGTGSAVCDETVDSPELCAVPGDDDCDMVADEEGALDCTVFWFDGDGDGWASVDAPTRCLCAAGDVPGYSATKIPDCDDGDPAVNPDAEEVCSALPADEDCDGTIDEADADGCEPWAADVDEDLHGDDENVACLCGPAGVYTSAESTGWDDCNDLDPSTYPGAPEVCDAVDHDCDEEPYEPEAEGCAWYYIDEDRDGYGRSDVGQCLCAPEKPFTTPDPGDCCDYDPDARPDQADWFVVSNACGDFDFDCDGVATMAHEEVGFCLSAPGVDDPSCPFEGCEDGCNSELGWLDVTIIIGDGDQGQAVPECGHLGVWLTSCQVKQKGQCSTEWEQAYQACR